MSAILFRPQCVAGEIKCALFSAYHYVPTTQPKWTQTKQNNSKRAVSISHKMSYPRISLSHEGVRLMFQAYQLLWNLAGVSATIPSIKFHNNLKNTQSWGFKTEWDLTICCLIGCYILLIYRSQIWYDHQLNTKANKAFRERQHPSAPRSVNE